MASTAITDYPNSKVTGLSMKVTKSGNTLGMSGSWKFPSSLTSGSKRADGIVYKFTVCPTNDSAEQNSFLVKDGKYLADVDDPRYTKFNTTRSTKTTSASWGNYSRLLAYPFTNTNPSTIKLVKVYWLTKVPTWNSKTKKWVLRANSTTYSWVYATYISQFGIKSWATVSKSVFVPKLQWDEVPTVFYKSLTAASEVSYHTFRKGTRPKLDRITLEVTPWNRLQGLDGAKYVKVANPSGNPNSKEYLEKKKDTMLKGYVYGLTSDTKVKSGKTYYTISYGSVAAIDPNYMYDSKTTATATFSFSLPDKPALTVSAAGKGTNHELTVAFKTAKDDTNKKERWDTKYVTQYSYGLKNSSNNKYTSHGPLTIAEHSKTNTALEFNYKLNPNTYLQKHKNVSIVAMDEGEWIEFTVDAYNRGVRGDTAHVKQTFLYAWPHDTVANTPTREGQHYKVTFKLASVAGSEKRRTASFTLQRLANFKPNASHLERWTNQQWLRAAMEASGWQDVATIGPGERGFSDNVTNATFEPTHRTYYRVKSNPAIEEMAELYSTPVVVPGYAVLANVDRDPAEIIELDSVDDGNAVRVVVAFTRTSTAYTLAADPTRNPHAAGLYEQYTDKNKNVLYRVTPDTFARNGKSYYTKLNNNPVLNSNGTEVSWATKNYAWQSSSQPSTHDIYDEDFGVYNRTDALNGKNGNAGTITAERLKKFPRWKTTAKQHFQAFYITGVELGKQYWVRARRFIKGSEYSDDQYGAYAKYVNAGAESPVIPKSRPKKVKLATSSVVPYDSAVELSWTYDDIGWTTSDAYAAEPQERYSVYILTGSSNAARATAKILSGHNAVQDSVTNATIKFSSIKNYLQPMSNSKAEMRYVLFFMVRICVGGIWSEQSNIVAVTFVKSPTATLVLESTTLTSLPMQATLKTNDPSAMAVVRITNVNGSSSWMPYGEDYQADGTVVYSRKYKPNWSLPDANGWCTATWSSSGTSLDLRDGGRYQLDFLAVNDYNESINLNSSFELYDQSYAEMLASHYDADGNYRGSSATQWGSPMNYDYATDSYPFDSAKYDKNGTRVCASSQFDVAWTHQAKAMPLYTGKGGPDARYCIMPPVITKDTVKFTLPQLWPSAYTTDVVDMYRVTPDGAYLVKANLKPGQTVEDTMPHYSNYATCRYRFATRTSDGDVDWVDVTSGKVGHSVRFDWGDSDAEAYGGYSYLELPYNLKWSDQWTKNVRIQLHMDGTYSGYWRGGVDHKNSLNSVMLKFTEREQIERLRALAQYPGPVFVRLPDGCAFCANVEVSGLDNAYDSLVQNVSISAQEITMIPQFSTKSVR